MNINKELLNQVALFMHHVNRENAKASKKQLNQIE